MDDIRMTPLRDCQGLDMYQCQGEDLSKLLQTFVANGILEVFKFDAALTRTYADDLDVIVLGEHLDTVTSLLKTTLGDINR